MSCPFLRPLSFPVPWALSPLHNVASVLVVTRVCCDGRSQKWGWGGAEGRWLLSRCCVPSLFLQICSSGPHALASASHTHPTPVSPLPFHSHFLFHFFPENFLLPRAWWQWVGRGPAGLMGRWEILPLHPSKLACYYSSTIFRYFTNS